MVNQVQLRDVTDYDLPILFEYQRDPEANAMSAIPARDENTFSTHWKKILSDPTNILKTIVYDGQVAGSIVSFGMAGEREVGYWIGREFWGKGIATQALSDFLTLDSTRPLYAYVAKHNIGSLRVLEKCGFNVTGENKYSNPAGKEVEEFILKLSA